MAFFIILLCSLFACTKVTLQGALAKGNIKNTADSVFANCLIFAFISILFSVSLRNGVNFDCIPYAIPFGILGVSFQVFYALSLKSGPFSITCMLMNLSMVVPVAFSLIAYDEKLTVLKVIGGILCILALFLNGKADNNKGANLKWILYVVLAFASTGGLSIVQKIYARSPVGGNYERFVFFGYLTAFIVSLVLMLIFKSRKSEINFKIKPRNLMTAFGVATMLGLYQYFNTYGNSFIDAIVLNPSVGGLTTMLQMVSGRIIFKEKFTVKQICSICIGIAAILLISM